MSAPTILETAIERSKKISPRTKELYLQHVRTFLVFAEGAKWTTRKVNAWRKAMRRRGIRPQSVNVALNALRFAARQAHLDFVKPIKTLPVQKRVRRTKTDRALTVKEGRALIAECSRVLDGGNLARGLRDAAIIHLGLRTGMLRFSMCKLQFSDYVIEGGNAQLTFVKKGGELHRIRLDPITNVALLNWIEWLRSKRISTGFIFRSLGRLRVGQRTATNRPTTATDTPVAIGKHLTPDGLYRALQQRAERAQIADLSPHVFRRTFIEWAKKAGAQPSQISTVTGHKAEGHGEEGADVRLPANFLIPDLV